MPKIIRLDSCASTNTELLRLAESGAEAFTTVSARRQTAGRGRNGHSWEAPAGTSLLFSTLLRPRVSVETLPFATLAAGIAVCEALRDESGLPAGIKWPNDLLVHGRKCAGILCEGIAGAGGPAIVAGIGVNVSTPADALPPRAIFPATSLSLEGARAVDMDRLLERILEALRTWIAILEQPGGGRTLVARVNELDALRGATLRVSLPDGSHVEGLSLGITEEGSLRLQTAEGPFDVLAGSVSVP